MLFQWQEDRSLLRSLNPLNGGHRLQRRPVGLLATLTTSTRVELAWHCDLRTMSYEGAKCPPPPPCLYVWLLAGPFAHLMQASTLSATLSACFHHLVMLSMSRSRMVRVCAPFPCTHTHKMEAFEGSNLADSPALHRRD